jgi:hypothetical protein
LQTHGSVIAPVTQSVRVLLNQKRLNGQVPKLTKPEKVQIAAEIAAREDLYARGGTDFSRIQVEEVLWQRDHGAQIEFETIGPYLADYVAYDGIMMAGNIIPEDRIGLELARVFGMIFPNGRLVSLLDEYNTTSAHSRYTGAAQPPKPFSATSIKNLRDSLVALFKAFGALPDRAVENEAYLLLEESSKLASAPLLVDRLDAQGQIRRNGQEILFVNDQAENPLHQSFRLRTAQGRWLCEALDASAFLEPDRVWEMLRLLNIVPHRYHNIFYEPDRSPTDTARSIEAAFSRLS